MSEEEFDMKEYGVASCRVFRAKEELNRCLSELDAVEKGVLGIGGVSTPVCEARGQIVKATKLLQEAVDVLDGKIKKLETDTGG